MNSTLGRPSLFNKVTCDEICIRLADGESLRSICSDAHMPTKTTVLRWLMDTNKKEFCVQYAQARWTQNELLADEIIELSNPPQYVLDSILLIHRNRLQIDTRKWWLSKVSPKKYGDKVEADALPEAVVENLDKLTDEEKYQLALLKRKMNGVSN